jgi:hypothetical protein
MPTYLSDGLAECQAQRAVAVTSADQTWADRCVRLAQRAIDAWNAANPQPTATPTVLPPTTSPGTTPPATTPPTPTPTVTTPPASGWPDGTNTGVPAGTTLTAYTGPCTITVAGTVIDAKTVACDLSIQTTGVVITRSRTQSVYADENSSVPVSFTISDSSVATPTGETGIGGAHYTATRVNITGGNRSAYCYADCVIRDSWAHAQVVPATSSQHASGIRFDHDTQFIHNRVSCDALDNPASGGCSASITGYPDWGPVYNVLIQDNFIGRTPGYFCAYGGATAGKPGSGAATNATDIRFVGNTFERGPSGHCGGPSDGWAVTDFAAGRTGNVWSGNVFDDGNPVASSKP